MGIGFLEIIIIAGVTIGIIAFVIYSSTKKS